MCSKRARHSRGALRARLPSQVRRSRTRTPRTAVSSSWSLPLGPTELACATWVVTAIGDPQRSRTIGRTRVVRDELTIRTLHALYPRSHRYGVDVALGPRYAAMDAANVRVSTGLVM